MNLSLLKKHWPEFLLLAAIVFFLRELLFFGKIFVPSDYGLGDYNLAFIPFAHYLADSLKQGEFPLWMPEIFGGFPITASGEASFFYPLNILLLYLFPFSTALNLYVLFTFLVMGFSTFYFLKSLDLSKEASLVGALSFTFAVGIVVRITHVLFLHSIAFLPLALLLTQKFFEKKNPLYLVIISVISSFQILNFSPPTTLICFLGFFLFFLFRSLTSFSKPKELIISLFVVFSLAISLSAIQIIPALEVFSLSRREAGIGAAEAKEFSFHPEELVYFLRPAPFGDYSHGTYNPPYPGFVFFWENNTYIGLLGLILGVFALLQIFSRTRKTVLFFSFLFVLSVLLALGQFTPFFFLLRIPPFSFFRVPGRYLFLSMFSLATLAAFGFQFLTAKFSSKRPTLGVLAAAIILADLFSFNLFYNPTRDAKEWTSAPQTAQFLKSDSSFFRIWEFGQRDAFFTIHESGSGWRKSLQPYFNLREGIPPNFNLLFSLNHASGWVGFQSKRSLAWEEILNKNIKIYPQKGEIELSPLAFKLLRIQNVKYVTTPFKTEQEDLILKKELNFETGQASFYLYELKNPLPHTFLVHQAKVVPGNDVLTELAREDFDSRKKVLLEEPFEGLGENKNISFEEAEVVEYLPEKVVIRAKTETPAFLVLTDTYFPGWEAKVNGAPTKIYQADYLFRAVKVEPGDHQVEFYYNSKKIRLGAIISFSTLFLLILFTLYWAVRTWRKKRK